MREIENLTFTSQRDRGHAERGSVSCSLSSVGASFDISVRGQPAHSSSITFSLVTTVGFRVFGHRTVS
jgi:hypothetical protein